MTIDKLISEVYEIEQPLSRKSSTIEDDGKKGFRHKQQRGRPVIIWLNNNEVSKLAADSNWTNCLVLRALQERFRNHTGIIQGNWREKSCAEQVQMREIV